MGMPKVSFIVPCFNQWEYLPNALGSIKAQTVKDHETILICETENNFPNSYAMVDKIIWHRENVGLAEARNSGLRVSQAEFVVPLDADDTIAPQFLEKTILARGIADAVAVNTSASFTDAIFQDNYLPYCALFRRSLFNRIGGWQQPSDEAQGMEDWDLWIRLRKHEAQVETFPDTLFHWNRHPNSMSSVFEKDRELFERMKNDMLRKNGLL